MVRSKQSQVTPPSVRPVAGCINMVGINFVEDPYDCTRYYLCVDEMQYPQYCGTGLVFDIVSQQCNRPELSVCVTDLAPPPIATPAPPPFPTTIIPPPPTVPVAPLQSSKMQGTLDPIGSYCVNNRGTTLQAIPNKCNSYVMCLDAIPYEMLCPVGMAFDSKSKLCKIASSVVCLHDTKLLCSKVGPGVTTVPYPQDCTKYLMCMYNEALEMSCGNLQKYDSLTNRCVAAKDALCSDSTSPIHPPATPFLNPCAGNSGVNFVPDPTNCQKYFMCVQTQSYENVCPTNQMFDIVTENCAPAAQATCVSESNNGPSGVPCANNQGIGYEPHPVDCSRYYMCMDAQSIERECAVGQIFDINRKACGPTATSTCVTATPSPSPSNPSPADNPCANNVGIGYLPHRQDCSRYYMCMDNQAIERTCDSGQVFDINRLVCGLRQNSVCILDSPGPGDIPQPPTRPPIVAPMVGCIGNEGIGFVPDPYDCMRYYLCVDEIQYPQYCGSGLVFDIVSEQCNRPELSVCATDVAPPPIATPAPPPFPTPPTIGPPIVTPPTAIPPTIPGVPTAPTAGPSVPTAPTPAPTIDPGTPTPPTAGPITPIPPTIPPPIIPPTPPPPVPTPPPPPVPTPPPPPVPTPPPPPVPTPPPPIPGNPPICLPDQQFFAPHPNCNRYFRCNWGQIFELECPPNLYWNQEREYCDHPFNVQCPSTR